MSQGRQEHIEIARIEVMVNKYRPFIHPFTILNLASEKKGDISVMRKPSPSKTKLTNKNTRPVQVNTYGDNGITFIPLPKSVSLTFPEKYIPAGSLFLVQFVGGDITKPIIIGRYENHGKY